MSAPSMQAAVLRSTRTLVSEARPVPQPGAGEVRLRVVCAGVCGTDLALWRGTYPVPLPMIPGHEVVATVDVVGPGVDPALRGTRVVPEINATCIARGSSDLCMACASGLDSHCTRRSVVGIVGHDGAFAEFLVVPAGSVHPVPPALSDVRAAFVEPAAAAIQTFEQAGDPSSASVVVLGPGRLGSLIVGVAADRGARVAAVARSDASHARARAFGAEATFTPDQIDAVRAWSGGLGADIVVEVTGQADALDLALDLVRPRGTVALKTTSGVRPPVDLTRVVVDEVRLVGSRCGPFDQALTWLEGTRRPIEDLVSATYPLSRAQEALQAAETCVKVLLTPG